MIPGNMLSTVSRDFSNVRAKWTLVYNSNFCMGTEMRIKIAIIERAMGTLYIRSASQERMMCQIEIGFVASPTFLTVKTARNS